MAVYTRSDLKTNISSMVSGIVSDTDQNTILNRAVREVLSDIDMRSMKRKTYLVPNLFSDIYDYAAPSDLKDMGIIDVRPQINRGRHDEWRLTIWSEFDRLKQDSRLDRWGEEIEKNRNAWSGESLIAVSETDMIKKVRISRPVDDKNCNIDPLDSVGNWVGYGDGTNLTRDSDNYVKGSACINWDINDAGGTTAGIVNSSLNKFNISDYLTDGSVFVWVYIPSTNDITNFKIRIGNDASNYYMISITTNNEGIVFQPGWNLLRFDLVNKVIIGNPDCSQCSYVAIFMTKDAAKVSETDYRFDDLRIKKGDKYEIIYYSKYGWQNSTGAYLENSTADTDYVNCDTDEIRLIEYKGAELMERRLKNHNEADRYLNLYERYKEIYRQNNPSEALILQQTYHFM